MSASSITVAICTWNRAPLLRQTLQHMTTLEIPQNWEWRVLVVDNNSTDETPDVVREFESRLPVISVRELVPGKSSALNRAIAEAPSDLIQLTDDDVLVDAGWVKACCHASERHPNAAAFGGPIQPWFPNEPDPDLLAAFPILRAGFCGQTEEYANYPEAPLGAAAPAQVFGANMALRRRALDGVGGFNPRLGPNQSPLSLLGEETDLLNRLNEAGKATIWVPDMRLRHYVDPARMTLPALLRYTEGSGYSHALRHPNHVRQVPCFRGVPRWIYRRRAELWANRARAMMASHRVRSLIAQRELAFHRGAANGYRAVHTQEPHTS